MPVYATRKIRNLAAALILLSGLTHVGQLWFVELARAALLTAIFGMVYLLIGLGLSGRSRFTLWVAIVIPLAGATAGTTQWASYAPDPLQIWHLLADSIVPALCVYNLYRTRFAEMD